jgi:hypothetical protein
MSFIGRIFVILFALLLSAVATGLVVTIALVVFAFQALGDDPVQHVFFWGTSLVASGIAAVTGFLPMLVAIGLAEALRVRSALIYALAGGALMLFGYYSAGFAWTYEESIDRPPPPISREAEIAVTGGVVFGLTYWIIAGRRAGAWIGKG